MAQDRILFFKSVFVCVDMIEIELMRGDLQSKSCRLTPSYHSCLNDDRYVTIPTETRQRRMCVINGVEEKGKYA